MTMTIFRIPSYSFNYENITENSYNILSALTPENKFVNITAGIGAGKTVSIAHVIATVIEFNLFKNILYCSKYSIMLDQFKDTIIELLTEKDIIIENYRKNPKTIITQYNNIFLSSFLGIEIGSSRGLGIDLVVLDEVDNMPESTYQELFPHYIRCQGIITTSYDKPKYFQSRDWPS